MYITDITLSLVGLELTLLLTIRQRLLRFDVLSRYTSTVLDNSSARLIISVGRTSGCKPKGLGLESCLTLTLYFESKNLSALSIDISNLSINISLISTSLFLIKLKKRLLKRPTKKTCQI